MNNYHTELDYDRVVILATKENSQVFFQAKISTKVKIEYSTKQGYSAHQWQYHFKPVNEENFPYTDKTHLVWGDLSYFGTIDEFKNNILYHVKNLI